MASTQYKIITFYEFKDMSSLGGLESLRERVRQTMRSLGIVGTVILAEEGYNGTAAGEAPAVDSFALSLDHVFNTNLRIKTSFSEELPFRKVDVKIKPEIVTLKKPVAIGLGEGTHVAAQEWNRLISDPEVVVLDARNEYEYRTGTFSGAVNPATLRFSELPEFVDRTLDPGIHKKVAMFCTGGIRCEKFAPYMKALGFEEVYQLEGGILKYLEVVPPDEQLWEGECFVFDGRVTVDHSLRKGTAPDLSQSEIGE